MRCVFAPGMPYFPRPLFSGIVWLVAGAAPHGKHGTRTACAWARGVGPGGSGALPRLDAPLVPAGFGPVRAATGQCPGPPSRPPALPPSPCWPFARQGRHPMARAHMCPGRDMATVEEVISLRGRIRPPPSVADTSGEIGGGRGRWRSHGVARGRKAGWRWEQLVRRRRRSISHRKGAAARAVAWRAVRRREPRSRPAHATTRAARSRLSACRIGISRAAVMPAPCLPPVLQSGRRSTPVFQGAGSCRGPPP